MKQRLHGGYQCIKLHKKNGDTIVQKDNSVHRLVALAHVDGKVLDTDIVDHVDGNRANNHASNLRWVCTATNQGNRNGSLIRLIE